MQEARVNSRCNDDLEPKVCWTGNESSIVPRISESQVQAQAFGSVDQTDDRRSCQRSRSPLQVPSRRGGR